LEPVTFLKYFKGHEHLDSIVKKLNAPPGGKLHLQGLVGSAKTIQAANIFKKLKQNMVLLLNDREEAAYFYDDLNNLGLESLPCFFPHRINVPYSTGSLSRRTSFSGPKH
jgi:transcription-repair coupling factor (superfamily II helicase)